MIKVTQETQKASGFNIQKIWSYEYADKLFNSPHTVSRSAMYSYRRPIAIIAIRLICNIHSHSFFCDIQNKPILIILSHLFCLKTLIFKVERSPMNPVLKLKVTLIIGKFPRKSIWKIKSISLHLEITTLKHWDISKVGIWGRSGWVQQLCLLSSFPVKVLVFK